MAGWRPVRATTSFGPGDTVQQFLSTAGGLFATLATFAGIWLGIWIAMRALHREKLSRLFGNSARLSRSGFLNGLAAVLVTSLLTELCYWIIIPEVRRGPIELGTWALYLLPILFFAFVQTSSEELLFRGYLQRGLAYRFRSPLVWAVLPTLVFTALHWNPASVLGMNIGVADLDRRLRRPAGAARLRDRQSRRRDGRASRQQSRRLPADLA